jgi:hypothetical protein
MMIHKIHMDHPPDPWITPGLLKIPLDGYSDVEDVKLGKGEG